MAAGILSNPGTESGPCEKPCQHVDCAETRRMASSRCRLCRASIGYGRQFFIEGVELVHVLCLFRELEGRTS